MESQIGGTTISDLQRGSPLMPFEISRRIHVRKRRKNREVIKQRAVQSNKFYRSTMESQSGETTISELQRGSPLMPFEISGRIHISKRRKNREVIKQ